MKRIKLAIIICFLFVFSCCSVNAGDGAPAVEWDRTYGAVYGQSVFPTDDGGYLIGGTTGDWPTSYRGSGSWTNHTAALIKIDASGELVWRKNYTRGHLLFAIVTSDGGYLLATSIESDFIKTDSQGNVQWTKTYAALDGASIFSFIQTRDGGYAIAGFGDHPISGVEGRLVKIDSEGNLQWNQTYGELNGVVRLRSVIETDDGYALAGTILAGSINDDMWLVKTDLEGNVEWEKRYGGQNSEGCASAVRAIDGGYLLAGYTRSFGAGDSVCFVVKTDSSGNLEWNQTYGGSGRDSCMSVVEAMDGGYVLTGFVNNTSNGQAAVVVKLSVSGELKWEKDYPGENKIQSVTVASDGGYVFVGYKGDSSNRDSEVWAVKLEPDYAHSAVDVLAWFFSADGVTITVAIVASCVTVIVVSSVIYKRRQTTNKT